VKVTCNCCILLCLKHLIIIILFYSFVHRKFYQTVKKRVDTYFKENNIVCRYQRRIILGKHVYSNDALQVYVAAEKNVPVGTFLSFRCIIVCKKKAILVFCPQH